MSFVCVEHKARFQSFPSPLHWVYVYIKLCVCLLLAFQCLYVYQCVTSMYVLKYMARSMCVCVCVCVCVGVWLKKTCTAHGLALPLLHQRNLASSRIRLCRPLLPPPAGPTRSKSLRSYQCKVFLMSMKRSAHVG